MCLLWRYSTNPFSGKKCPVCICKGPYYKQNVFLIFPWMQNGDSPPSCHFLCRNLTSGISEIFLKQQSLVCWFLSLLIYSWILFEKFFWTVWQPSPWDWNTQSSWPSSTTEHSTAGVDNGRCICISEKERPGGILWQVLQTAWHRHCWFFSTRLVCLNYIAL